VTAQGAAKLIAVIQVDGRLSEHPTQGI
jgi:hypothetical protein